MSGHNEELIRAIGCFHATGVRAVRGMQSTGQRGLALAECDSTRMTVGCVDASSVTGLHRLFVLRSPRLAG